MRKLTKLALITSATMGKLIGREMSDREIKSLSHNQLVEVANGDWQSNS
jgi:hypothetical protein